MIKNGKVLKMSVISAILCEDVDHPHTAEDVMKVVSMPDVKKNTP